MLKATLKDIILYSFNSILSKGIAFFLIPIFTSILLPSEYGIIDTFLIIGGLVKVFIGFEITQGIARFYLESKDIEKPMFVTTAFIFYVFCYLIYFIVVFIFSDSLNLWITEKPQFLTVYYLAMSSIAANSIYFFWQNQLRWGLKSKEYTINSIAYTILTYGLSITFIVFMNMRLEGYFLAALISSSVMAIYIMYRERNLLIFGFQKSVIIKLLNYSFPLVFSSIAVISANYMDRIAIRDILNLDELGIYGTAFRIASMISIIFTGIRIAIGPLIYKHYEEARTPQRISDLTSVFIVITTICISTVSIFSKEIVTLLTPEAYFSAWKLLPLIMLATFISSAYIFTPGISIVKKTRIILIINIVGLFTNLIFNYSLIPYFGAVGAASATLICAIIAQTLYTRYSQKFYYIPFDSALIALCASLGVITISVFAYSIQIPVYDLKYTFLRLTALAVMLFIIWYSRRGLWKTYKERLVTAIIAKSKNDH